ncbi:magnesium transporter CorA family protein [Congregibacter variabilis]|uniref:Magnesium transporter CorA family protein n=1 Tax=Congregibacter variabilis TaxID=3081200 RepID=A0ABZ0I6B7_9GAMM|nr:magnesium transporter CorA family protein [Congregibacter sp. IMCC43200]
MIKAMWLGDDGEAHSGKEEIVAKWQASTDTYLWLDFEGSITPDFKNLLKEMGCDPLAITDSSRVRHPPKVEHFEHNTFVLFRGISSLGADLELEPQQLGIWVGDRCLITVHRGESVSVDYFWERATKQKSLAEPGRLALRIIHYASGRYLTTLLDFEERLSALEDGLLSDISELDMKELVAYRTRLRKLRRIFSYHKVLAESIWRQGGPYLGNGDDALAHMRRDVYDRCERVYSLCSMYYELCSDLVEGHISLSSHNLNVTMKILTIISAIFVPMTFMAGIYGMNFEHMPELGWRYAYFSLLGLMGVMAVSMLVVFKKVKWL